MAPRRDPHHGDHVRSAALSFSAHRRSDRADRGLLPRRAGNGRGAGAARLLVRQSPGNSVRARRRRSQADVARHGPSDDADLRTVRAIVLRIRALQLEQCRRQSPDLSAEREPVADAGKNSRKTRGDDQRLGGGAERDLSLPGRCRVPPLRPRGLHRSGALCRSGETSARVDTARIRRGICARFARARDRRVGIERGKPNGTYARENCSGGCLTRGRKKCG